MRLQDGVSWFVGKLLVNWGKPHNFDIPCWSRF